MRNTKISALEVLRIFYINQELLPSVFKAKRLSHKIVDSRLKKMLKVAKKIPKEELVNYHTDHWNIRYYNYLNAKWELREVELKECGVWPGMSSLPEEATYGSPVETAQYVQQHLDDRSKITWDNHRVLYIEHVKQYAELISKYVPIILLEGGVIRENHSEKVVCKSKMKKFRYDIDDGNNRAVALALLGNEKVHAIVGKRIHKSDLFN